MIRNITSSRKSPGLGYHLFFIDQSGYKGLRIYEKMNADSISRFKYNQDANLFNVCRKFGRRIKSFGNRSVLVTNSEFDLYMAAVCRLKNPIIHISHGDNELVYNLARWYAPIIDHHVAVSHFIADQLTALSGINPEQISYIPHPVPFSGCVRCPAEKNLRIVFVGRLVKGKGIFLMPEIERELRKRQVFVDWIFIGDGIDSEEFQRQWPENASVNWVGEVTNRDVFNEMAKGDIFLLPSYTEGFPLVLAEAMSVGLVPIVSNLRSGIPEIVEEGGTGFRCPLNSISKIVEDICGLHADREKLERMSIEARKRVVNFFDPFRRAGEYEALFRMLAAMPERQKAFPHPFRQRIMDRSFIPSFINIPLRQSIRQYRLVKKNLLKSV